MAVVTMKQLLEAGVHFGHQTRRWNPKMRRFIHGERSGIYIIDLQQTLDRIEKAYVFVRDLVADGGRVLFVGTKRQAQDPINSYAEKCGMPFINQRWLGGTLTNFSTISKRVAKMLEYQRMRDSGEFDAMPKKEALLLSRELDKLERNLGGIRDMEGLPDAIFVIDTVREHIAVTEANKLGIPVVAVVDTDCDPDVIQYLIPGNDDAIRSGRLLCRILSDAVEEGRFIANARNAVDDDGPSLDAEDRAVAQADARVEAGAAAVEREARVAAVVVAPAEVEVPEAPVAADAPVEAAPVVEAPVEAAPVVEAAVEAETVADAPVEAAPAVDAPVEAAPVEAAPVVEAPVEAAPVVEAPVEAETVADAPVAEAPVEAETVADAPVVAETVVADAAAEVDDDTVVEGS
jgi:small subunit ribosomal protein S2